MLVFDLPILREEELVLVWTVHTLLEYANVHCLRINSQVLFSAGSALYSCLRISDFASASNYSIVFPHVILI